MTAIEHYWEPGRYQPALLPANARGVCLWGIRDLLHGGWVEEDEQGKPEPLAWALVESAQAWIDRTRHMTEGRARAAG